MLHHLLRLAPMIAVLLPCSSLAQGVFLGSWTVVAAQPAPWVAKSPDKIEARSEPAIAHARIVIQSGRIEGPQPIGCQKPHYQVAQVPPEELFEGGLDDPDRGMTDPKGAASALGFRSPNITTLQPGCDIEFHMVDNDTVLFALNNMLYTMHRNPH